MKKIKLLGFPILISLLFTACSSGLYQTIENPTYSKEKSYLSFIRPFGGAAYSYTILEVNPENYETKLVGIVGDSSNLLYETTPGEKYFYVSSRETNGISILAVGLHSLVFKADRGDLIKTNLGKGKIYQFFYDETKIDLAFYPLDGRNFKLIEEIKKSVCNTENLTKFGLEKISNDNDQNIVQTDSYENSDLKITVECRNNKFYNPRYFYRTIDDLKDYKIIKLNNEALVHYQENKETYTKKIKSLFSDYEYNLKVDEEFGLDFNQYKNYK
jgi:hypothetical protein